MEKEQKPNTCQMCEYVLANRAGEFMCEYVTTIDYVHGTRIPESCYYVRSDAPSCEYYKKSEKENSFEWVDRTGLFK